MAFNWHGARRYYYLSGRVDGRVVKTYVGIGEKAEAVALEVDLRKLKRARLISERRLEDDAHRAAVGSLIELCHLADQVLRMALAAAGFHQHDRGQWRRRRRMASLEPRYSTELGELLARGNNGDVTVLTALKDALASHPELVEMFGNLAAHAEESLLTLTAGTCLTVRESIRLQLDQLRQRLLATVSSELERLLVERLVLCWLGVHQAELDLAARLQSGNGATPAATAAAKRLEQAHRRFLTATKAMSTVEGLVRRTASPLRIAIGTIPETAGGLAVSPEPLEKRDVAS